jgi:hypothetical protein
MLDLEEARGVVRIDPVGLPGKSIAHEPRYVYNPADQYCQRCEKHPVVGWQCRPEILADRYNQTRDALRIRAFTIVINICWPEFRLLCPPHSCEVPFLFACVPIAEITEAKSSSILPNCCPSTFEFTHLFPACTTVTHMNPTYESNLCRLHAGDPVTEETLHWQHRWQIEKKATSHDEL